MTNPPTPISTLEKAREIAKKYLNFVYIGNLPGVDSNTYCPNCGNLLVERHGFYAKIKGLEGNRCNRCGSFVNVVV